MSFQPVSPHKCTKGTCLIFFLSQCTRWRGTAQNSALLWAVQCPLLTAPPPSSPPPSGTSHQATEELPELRGVLQQAVTELPPLLLALAHHLLLHECPQVLVCNQELALYQQELGSGAEGSC